MPKSDEWEQVLVEYLCSKNLAQSQRNIYSAVRIVNHGNAMKTTYPSVGTISGFSIGASSAAAVCILALISLTVSTLDAVNYFAIAMISAKLFGIYLFYRLFEQRSHEYPDLKQWPALLNSSLLSHPNVILPIGAAILEFFAEAAILSTVTEVLSPTLACTIYLICQAVGSLAQGTLSEILSRKRSIMFSVVAILFSQVLLLSFDLNSPDPSQPITLLERFSASPAQLSILIILIKGLFGNTMVISLGIIFETLCVKTLQTTNNVKSEKH